MREEVRRIAEMQDHASRVRAAAGLMSDLQADLVEIARIRRESIAWLRANGHSLADVARLIGTSRARVAQLKDVGPPPERAFLGSGRLRIAVPERPGGRRLVARADSTTGQRIMTLAHDLGLDAEIEYIPVSGTIDLDRDDLVVVCGPKTSAAVARVLAADPHLAFEELPDGSWALIERATGRRFTSPQDRPDEPRPGDVAYLGRLRQPGGASPVLYIAGVHAIGSLGAAHYLAENVAELYGQVGTREFSMVIGSHFDPTTEEIVETTAHTAVLPHGS